MLLRQGIRYWLLLGYNIVYILSYSFLQPLFLFLGYSYLRHKGKIQN